MAYITKALKTTLRGVLSANGNSFTVLSFTDHKGNPLAFSDFGGNFVVVIEQGEKIELVLISGITQNSDDTATLSIATDGRHLDGKYPYTGYASGLSFTTGASVIVSNDPYTLSKFAQGTIAQSISAIWTFITSPIVPIPTTGTQAANKDYVDGVALASAPDASTTGKGVSRLSVAPDKTLGTCTLTIASPCVATLNAHGLTVNDIVRFTTDGALPTGITVGVNYYVITSGLTANTFQLSTSQGGAAVNTSGSQSGVHTLVKMTPVAVGSEDARVPTQTENDALAGGGGLGTPSSSNKFFTEEGTKVLVPAGTVSAFAGASAPTGYLLCDGAAVSRTVYADLFASIGVVYGSGDGSTTFNVPNLKGRVLVGKDASQTEFDVLGETGGSKTSTHIHASGTLSGTVSSGGGGGQFGGIYSGSGIPLNVPSLTGSTGASADVILPPYLVLNYVIKT